MCQTLLAMKRIEFVFFVELCLLNDKKEAFVQQKRDNLVQKIQFLLKYSVKADIRSKKEIISAIEKLEE